MGIARLRKAERLDDDWVVTIVIYPVGPTLNRRSALLLRLMLIREGGFFFRNESRCMAL